MLTLRRRLPPLIEFDWTVGEARPRYIRYKPITSSKQEGTMRFSAKDWASLPDGEYVFSIDTGSLPVGAAGSNSYCVSQRLQIVDEAVVRLIGRAHGSPLPPTANQIALGRGRLGSCPTGAGAKSLPASGTDDSDDSDDGAAQQYLFAVPLLECALPRAARGSPPCPPPTARGTRGRSC